MPAETVAAGAAFVSHGNQLCLQSAVWGKDQQTQFFGENSQNTYLETFSFGHITSFCLPWELAVSVLQGGNEGSTNGQQIQF